MSIIQKSIRVTTKALLLSTLLTGVTVTTLTAQQVAATEIKAPAAAVPAPASSSLFARAEERPATIAAAQAANAAAPMSETHVFRVSTLVLILGVIILVLLIV